MTIVNSGSDSKIINESGKTMGTCESSTPKIEVEDEEQIMTPPKAPKLRHIPDPVLPI